MPERNSCYGNVLTPFVLPFSPLTATDSRLGDAEIHGQFSLSVFAFGVWLYQSPSVLCSVVITLTDNNFNNNTVITSISLHTKPSVLVLLALAKRQILLRGETMYLYCIPDFDCVAVFVNFENEIQFQSVVDSVLELHANYQLADFSSLEVDDNKNEISFIVKNVKGYKIFKKLLKQNYIYNLT